MTITELVAMAERIHDTEGHNLGANSTRETRNAYWMFVIGCAHFGHPAYNPTPDPRWHVKDGGGGRPMSDDVAVLLPSREAWDCIPGAGSNGYRFEADAIGVLPREQHVYAPTRPSDAGTTQPPAPPASKAYPGDAYFIEQLGAVLQADYQAAGQTLNAGSVVWIARTIWRTVAEGMPLEESTATSRRQWRDALGLPPP